MSYGKVAPKNIKFNKMDETVVVSVKEGKLRGITTKSTFSGAKFYSFYGVPYGEAPMKNLRFKDPVKVKPWKSIRDATKETKSGCIQFSLLTKTLIGSEDCLYMHIYTPQMPSEGMPLKPVIVCIPPGTYRYGSPETWHLGNPDFLMHHDVVYVCLSFRLHIFGFLNLNMEECSGNQYIKDIILALKWIKDNIHNFNGDKENITLYGSSSGGNTINLLTMSPAAKGLFHKAVMSSPVAISTVFIDFQDENESTAFRLGHILGFKGDNPKKLLNFLKKLPAELLTESQRECEKQLEEFTAPVFPHSVFLPTVDTASESPVIPISPKKLIQTATPIPFVLGICERESIMGFSSTRLRELTEKNYQRSYRHNQWSWMSDLSDDEMKSLNDQVERFYLKEGSFEDASLSAKVDMITEIALHDLYDTVVNPVAERLPSSVYLYKYKFDNVTSDMKTLISLVMDEKLSGSYHACDYACWSCSTLDPSGKDVQMIHTYTKMITTFAKNSDPNYEELGVQWRPTTVDKPCYLSIDSGLQMVDGRFHNESVEFWKNIKKQFKKN